MDPNRFKNFRKTFIAAYMPAVQTILPVSGEWRPMPKKPQNHCISPMYFVNVTACPEKRDLLLMGKGELTASQKMVKKGGRSWREYEYMKEILSEAIDTLSCEDEDFDS